MDTFTCGNCQLLFTDIELFMTHKKSDCSSENATNASLPPVLPETTSDIAPAADSIITPLPIVTVPPLVQPQVDTSQPVTDAIIFVCKHCNLFSTVKEELIEHVKDEHQVIEDDVDSSISSLQPLPGSMPPPTAKLRPAVQKIVTVPFGRRRGRPRKVPKTEEQLKEEARLKNEAQERAAEAKKKEEEMMQQGDGFACSTCKRKFTRLRQMKSHRCVVDVFDDEPPTKRMRGRPGLGTSDGYENSDDTSCTQLNLSVSSGATQPSLTVFDGSNQAGMDVPQEYPDGNSLEENAEDEKKDKRSRMSYLEKYVVGEITEHCIQQTINQGAAIPHRSNTTNPVLRVFTCPHCNKLFKYRHALAVHILIHKDIKPFKCNRCNYASNSSGNLNVHMRKHTGEKFRCSKCDFTCINKGHLKVHMAKHGTDRYECELCGKKVHHPTELVKHIKYKHDIDRDNKAKEYFERKKMESRSGRRALLYQCNICERKFKTKRDHDMHLYLHTNEKPYKCELCEYSTARKPYMKVHVKKHRIVYKCCFCNESFISSHRLSVHLQESHGDLQDFDINDVYNKSVNCSLYLVEPGGKNITADEASALAILQQENIDTSEDNLDFTAMFSKGSISNIQTELEEKNDISRSEMKNPLQVLC
uniref:Zinc finger protein ZFAT-like n=1 Tax=Saccoglossus kowalevskii TaxID=10224 RepID=A0ABM0N0R9_SACKO|nr:PREDICTED: zinc finger protein ZFAT-like [Saccoglossus kowalevskii]